MQRAQGVCIALRGGECLRCESNFVRDWRVVKHYAARGNGRCETVREHLGLLGWRTRLEPRRTHGWKVDVRD